MNYYIITKDELNHYGVKGMKWGIRHDPERVGRNGSRSPNNSKRQRRKGLSKAQKIALGIGATAAIAGVSYAAYKSGKFNKLIQIGSATLNKNNLNGTNPKLERLMLEKSELIKNMNPDNDNYNCAFTSSGYIFNKITGKSATAVKFELDLIPGKTTMGGTLPEFFDDVFSGIKRIKTNPNAKFYNQLPKMEKVCRNIPDNSNGILFMHNRFGFGHYVNYEKVDGAMRIIDCQSPLGTGKQIDTVKNWSKKGFRITETIDCTNASIKNEKLLKKVLKY